jgi:hypothetical protein
MEWDSVAKITEAIDHGVTAVAVLVGAFWAYFRFVRFRTLKPRVKFTIECTRSDLDSARSLLILTLKLQNTGRAKVVLRRDKSPSSFLKYALIKESGSPVNFALVNVPPGRLKHLDTVFDPHRWIEPGETIDDVKLVEVERSGLLGIQLEVVVFGAKKYTAPAAISLLGMPARSCSDSEDEQDDYTKIEKFVEELESVLEKLLRLGEDHRNRIRGLIDEIDRCHERLKLTIDGQPGGVSDSELGEVEKGGRRLADAAYKELRSVGYPIGG